MERTKLNTELAKLNQELEFGKEQMHRKNEEYQSTLEDLANAHRIAEDARLNAIQELEAKKYEVSDLEQRLNINEQRLTNLQQEYVRADSERDILNDALKRFQSIVNRIITLNRLTGPAEDGVKSGFVSLNGQIQWEQSCQFLLIFGKEHEK